MKTTLAEFKCLPRLSVRTTSGWQSSPSCNTPVRRIKVEVIYTTKTGERRVFGSATANSRDTATREAWNDACAHFNADERDAA